MDDGFELAGGHLVDQTLQVLAGPAVRAQDVQLPGPHVPQVGDRLEPGGGAARHHAPFGAHAADRPLPGLLSEVVDHHVGAAVVGQLPHATAEVPVRGVHGLRGTQRAEPFQLDIGGRAGDDAGAGPARKLHARHANPAGGAQDYHRLVGPQAGPVEQHPAGRAVGDGQGCVPGQVAGGMRQRDRVVRRRHHELGQPSPFVLAQHPAANHGVQQDQRAHQPACVLVPRFLHPSHDVAPGDVRQVQPHARHPPPDEDVEAVEGARGHPHQDLARSGLRALDLAVLQGLGPAVLPDEGRLHQGHDTGDGTVPARWRVRTPRPPSPWSTSSA